jgi:surface antigen
MAITVALACAGMSGGCALNMDSPAVNAGFDDITGSIHPAKKTDSQPSASDLALTRTAASDVLAKGGRNASQPWENPQTGARGTVTPLATAYTSDDGRTCRDFLASFVKGEAESWMQGEACKAGEGHWEIRAMRPWQRS